MMLVYCDIVCTYAYTRNAEWLDAEVFSHQGNFCDVM